MHRHVERNLAFETALVRDRAEALLERLVHTRHRRCENTHRGPDAAALRERGAYAMEQAVIATRRAIEHLNQTIAITQRDLEEQRRPAHRGCILPAEDGEFLVNWGD